MMEMAWKKWLAGPVVALLIVDAMIAGINEQVSSPLLYRTLRRDARGRRAGAPFSPPSLGAEGERSLSLYLGGGDCKWQPPEYEVPEEIDFHKTVVAGYPSGDKRMIYIQMEALTGWPAKDEWDFEYLGMSNHPFIKANYPHHEGIWGWGDVADQVVIMIRNIRRSMVEYHDILWDIDYAKTWAEARPLIEDLFAERPPIEDFFAWRDEKVLDEIYRYGWFIDYWMEAGLLRDIFTHKITTPEHWNMITQPTVYKKDEVAYDIIVGNDTVVAPSYDPHCTGGDVSGGCEPVAVISGEELKGADGPQETERIANVLMNDFRTGQYVIAADAWDCIWEELIQNGKGLRTVYDRPGYGEQDYNFSAEMLEGMISELDRLVAKYSEPDWSGKATADRIVELLTEHRALIQAELDEVNAGTRRLTKRDFLGPKERERRRMKLEKNAEGDAVQGKKDYSRYFRALDLKIHEDRRKKKKVLAQKHAKEYKEKTSAGMW